MSYRALLIVKVSDGVLAPKYAKKIEDFRKSQGCDVIISQEVNRFTAIIDFMDKYDYIFWTNNVNTLMNDIALFDILKDDVVIVSSEDRHMLIVKSLAKVRKLLYHWSQSVKDIYTTSRWKKEVVEIASLNAKQDDSEPGNGIIELLNEMDQKWLLVILIFLLIVVSTKL
jgi:hypothetical protein